MRVLYQVYVEAYTCPCVRCHPFDPCFVAQSNGNYIAIFSTNPPFKLDKYKRYESHGVSGFPIKCNFSSDGEKLVSGSSDGSIYFYSYRSSDIIKKIKAYEQACIDVAFHPIMPNVIASCGWNGEVSVFEWEESLLSLYLWALLAAGKLSQTNKIVRKTLESRCRTFMFLKVKRNGWNVLSHVCSLYHWECKYPSILLQVVKFWICSYSLFFFFFFSGCQKSLLYKLITWMSFSLLFPNVIQEEQEGCLCLDWNESKLLYWAFWFFFTYYYYYYYFYIFTINAKMIAEEGTLAINRVLQTTLRSYGSYAIADQIACRFHYYYYYCYYSLHWWRG